MPAKAGIQNYLISLGSRLRGNDAKGGFKTFYETINNGFWLPFHRVPRPEGRAYASERIM